MADDETVSQFLAFTACADPDTAVSYLEMSGGSLETAVGLYMEHAGGGGASGVGPDSGAAAPLPADDGVPDDAVRAPDRTRTERLVGGHPQGDLEHMLPGILRGPDMNEVMRPAAFADSDDEEGDGVVVHRDVREQLNRAADPSSSSSSSAHPHTTSGPPQPTTLSNMFAPPTHLLHRAGGFQGARAVARDTRRWLLVNLQRDAEFSSHALNRDVWGNDLVENLVTSGFIFWQAMDDTNDGATYVQRYGVASFPHVAILDPRTGRLMWKKEGWTQVNPMTAEEFSQKAADFCSLHSFDKPPSAANLPGSRPNRAVKRPVEELSEQEQLAKAIRESQGMDTEHDDGDSDDDDYLMVDDGDDDDGEIAIPLPPQQPKSPSPPPPPTFEEEICAMEVGEEPTEGGARLQFRMPDGGRVVRRFRMDDVVKIIYAFVAQSSEDGKTGKPFVLRAGFPPKDLITKLDESIESCSLSGESVTVRWK